MPEREDEWTGLMRLAVSGDDAAYFRVLKAVTPVLRPRRAAVWRDPVSRSTNPRISCRIFCWRCI